ncbi:MAG: DUF4175 domain-containing protein [Polyangiaceae bacterium]|nr:DUF4175 domain-containing protein [Polyangiaceae bacterium]
MSVPRLDSLVTAWRRTVAPPARRAVFAIVLAGVFGGAHLSRSGTVSARLGVALGLAILVLGLLASGIHQQRALRDPRRALRLVLAPAAPSLAGQVLRALTLVERAERNTLETSPTLARAHFERLLDRAPPELIVSGAKGRVWRLRWTALGGGGLALAALVVGPMRIVEGFDVLVAQNNQAPLALFWLDEVTVVAHPPSYLRREDRWLLFGTRAREPEGAQVSVRGTPRRAGRALLLTDGTTEVPFVSDGEGGVVAHFSLDKDTYLRVAARFGDVLVLEPNGLRIDAVPDQPPTVTLMGAPRTVAPDALGRRLELHFAVTDDHGLRQVDLVLRAGNREDRRVLARLDGEVQTYAGGYVLEAADPFLRGSFLPTVVTIEVRDNQPSELPRWGRSAALTLVPPPIGQPEANRLAALEAGRDAVVDLVAWQLDGGSGTAGESEWMARAAAVVVSGLEVAEEALPIHAGFATFVRGQARVLTQPRGGTSTLRASEDVVLALDAALGRLAFRDARDVSIRLGEVAEEAAAGARQARETEQRSIGLERFGAAFLALEEGVSALTRLGPLGADLGSVAEGNLDRIRRASAAEDLRSVELAARHLAARLRRPAPSFSAKHIGGVESSGGAALDVGEASQADQRFDELAQDLERLTQDHASEIGAVERALSEAERAADLEAIKEEARRRAMEIALAVADLPAVGDEPGSSRSAASRARQQANAMAQSLERLSFGDAVERGRDALGALDEARRKRTSGAFESAAPDPAVLDAARRPIAEHLTWAERELDRLHRLADERARAALTGNAERERKHADRASNVASRGRNGQSSLPEDLIGRLERAEALMRQAADQFSTGRGRDALDLQRDAQRLLEQATVGRTSDQGSAEGERRNRGAMTTRGEVPNQEDDRSQEFRRRVVEGLGRERSGRYAPAVRRYAEGLLR